MSIATTYRTLLIEEYLKDRISRGITVSTTDLQDFVEDNINSQDLSTPEFSAKSSYVNIFGESSASNMKANFSLARQDLTVLYKELLRLSRVNENAFNRWNLEAESIEKQLIDLEERIENLLLLSQDIEGYHSVIIDNFTDTSLVDLENTTASHDPKFSNIELSETSSEEPTRLFLNELEENVDVTFKVRSDIHQLNRVDAVRSSLTNIFNQENKSWWTSVNMRKQRPVTCELLVKLGENPVELNKIFLELHDSSENSPIFITPLYSTDNVNFNQLPTNTFTLEVRTNGSFSFSTIEAKYIKFLLTKKGPDPSSGQDFFSYQFGFKHIEFYSTTGYITSPNGIFISEPLSALNVKGQIKEFEKLTLETCEKIEENTNINYFITVSNDPDIPLDSNKDPIDYPWTPISPIQRSEALHETILDVGDIVTTTMGDSIENDTDDEIVTISYDANNSDPDFVNPNSSFTVLSRHPVSGQVIQEARSASSEPRYTLVNLNDRILSHQIKDTDNNTIDSAINFEEESLVLFRNVGKKGINPGDSSEEVRDVSRGWKFKDPYYTCVIEIENPEGISMNVGQQEIIIDGVAYTNLISNSILTGKSGVGGDNNNDSGVHTVKIHKDNWVPITSELNSLTELKAADPLYPFNHKYLIEGYKYGNSYPSTEEKIYQGVDLFAETVMRKVSVFDFVNNVAPDRYDLFALDRDAPKIHDSPNEENNSTLVFLVKVDEENPDFQNERFVIRFSLVNELRKYLRLKAELSTEDQELSPELHSYKIKLG